MFCFCSTSFTLQMAVQALLYYCRTILGTGLCIKTPSQICTWTRWALPSVFPESRLPCQPLPQAECPGRALGFLFLYLPSQISRTHEDDTDYLRDLIYSSFTGQSIKNETQKVGFSYIFLKEENQLVKYYTLLWHFSEQKVLPETPFQLEAPIAF